MLSVMEGGALAGQLRVRRALPSARRDSVTRPLSTHVAPRPRTGADARPGYLASAPALFPDKTWAA